MSAISFSPEIIKSGLVFSVDAGCNKSYSPNVIPNPIDLFAWCGGAVANNCTISRDLSATREYGSFPLKMVVTGDDAYIGSYSASQWNLADAANGQTWTVSVYAKANQITNGQLFIFGANDSGVVQEFGSSLKIITSDWTRFTFTYTTTSASTTKIQARLDGTGSGGSGITIWWDGMQLEKAASATRFNPNYFGNTVWKDLTKNNNNGSLINGPTFNVSNGGCLRFDGIDDYVNINNGSVLNNWNPDGTSVSLGYRGYSSLNIWFRASTINTGGVSKILFSDNFGVEYGFYQNDSTFYLNAVASKSTTIVANRWYNACLVADVGRPATGTYSQSGTTTITCTTTYPLTFSTGNTVYVSFVKTAGSGAVPLSQNYVVTVTGTNTFTVTSGASATSSGTIIYNHSSNTSTVTAYIDGTQLGLPATSNTSNGVNDAPFNIGRDNGSATSYFAGDIAIVQLYSRKLLTSEVLSNYNNLKTRFL